MALVMSLVAVETTARVLVARPGRSMKIYRTTRSPVFWADVDPNFGVWHPANATFHHVGQCFDVTYRTNSYGARDAERARVAPQRRRHVVLGDSFVEGYGVAEGERLTDRLNGATRDEFLNFGTSGGFGTVQELVLYRSLASAFAHADVLVFALPANDFSDNDPKYWPSSRYRPYLRRTATGLETYYTVPFESRDRDRLSVGQVLWNGVSNYSGAVNLARQAIERRLPHDIAPEYTSYTGHSDEEL
jgi:lysophospholipase L1-like esterase